MRSPLIVVLLALAACCPTRSGPPGDQGAASWKLSNTVGPEREVIDCGGEERDSLTITKPTVVRNCIIRGSLRIQGAFKNANDPALILPSRRADYVEWIREQAPHGVLVQDVAIIGEGTVPFYVGPGVVGTTAKGLDISGVSRGPMVYLGAESTRTTITGSLIDARGTTHREAIAIDASDHNRIEGNNIRSLHGGIFLYRNCGEGGVSRHTTPSDNVIEDNVVTGGAPTDVWLSARDGFRCYCGEDDDSEFGSGPSDLDHARRNVVRARGLVRLGPSAIDNDVSSE